MTTQEQILRLRSERDVARSEAQSLRVRLLQVEIELNALRQVIADALINAQLQAHAPTPPPAPPVPSPAVSPEHRLVRKHEVVAMVGLCSSTIYRRIAEGTFPAPLQLGARGVAWREADLLRWQQALRSGVRGPYEKARSAKHSGSEG